MTASFNLKESGIKWVGQIPTDWTTTSVNKAFNITLGKMLQPAASNPNDLLVPYLKAYNVQDGSLKMDKVDTMYCSQKDLATYKLQKGDLLVCEGGEVARSTLITEDMPGYIIQNSLHLVTAREGNLNSYLHFLLVALRHSGFINILVNKATISHFTKDKFSSLKIPLPKFEMQKSIVRYLEIKIVEINELVSAKQNLIHLLEQQRQSIITEAVTKGLNPNVKMKDSGVEGIGKIANNFNLAKIKHLVKVKVTDGPHETPILTDSGVPFISAEAIKDGKVNFNFKRGYISKEDHIKFSRKCRPKKGDIFMVKSGATTGKLAIVETDEEFSIWSPLALIRSESSKINNLYLFFCLQSKIFQNQVQTGWNYGTQQNIGMGVIENLYIPYPQLNEQILIVDYLIKNQQNIINSIETINLQIEKLKEYRQSLIYEAVTGKIDVREMELEEVR